MTAWPGENDFAATPVATYSFVLFMAAAADFILTTTIISSRGKDSILASVVGKDFKGTLSVILYAPSIPLAFLKPAISMSIYILVAVTRLTPDKRIEKKLFRGAF